MDLLSKEKIFEFKDDFIEVQMITLCPNCKNKFDVPQEYIGKQIKCSKCNETFNFIAPEELCENCGCVIGILEQAHIYQNKIVCDNCDKILQQEIQLTAQQNTTNFPTEADITKNQNAVDDLNITNVFITGRLRKAEGKPRCQLCGSLMKKKTIRKKTIIGIAISILCFFMGILITFVGFIWGGPIIGIPICIFALFIGGKKVKVFKCKNCAAIVQLV